jgi:hypothetical protein
MAKVMHKITSPRTVQFPWDAQDPMHAVFQNQNVATCNPHSVTSNRVSLFHIVYLLLQYNSLEFTAVTLVLYNLMLLSCCPTWVTICIVLVRYAFVPTQGYMLSSYLPLHAIATLLIPYKQLPIINCIFRLIDVVGYNSPFICLACIQTIRSGENYFGALPQTQQCIAPNWTVEYPRLDML